MNSYKLIAAPSGITGGAEPSLSTSKIRTSTVELPVMVGLRLLFLRINAGPVFNLLTDTSVKSDKTPHTVDIVRPSISFAVGIGADIGKINVDLRYNGNFKRPEQFIRIADQQSLPYKTKFRSWALSVGYLF